MSGGVHISWLTNCTASAVEENARTATVTDQPKPSANQLHDSDNCLNVLLNVENQIKLVVCAYTAYGAFALRK